MQRGQWFEGPEWLLKEEEWPEQPELKKPEALAKSTAKKEKKCVIQGRRSVMSGTLSSI